MKFAWLDNECHRAVLLFGIGLIGRSVYTSLVRATGRKFEDVSVDWHDSHARRSQLATIYNSICERSRRIPDALRVEIVWSAGRAGLAATAEQLEQEDASFRDVVALARDLADSIPAASHHFHMMSSAGGLFEGQRLVDRTSEPRPSRPYGMTKLAQEKHLGALPAIVCRSIYRPSSVYGYARHGGRAGLISVLIDNASRYRTSNIFGDINTLRDYVLADDIGRFVAARIMSHEQQLGPFFLASAKPAAISEILHIVGKVVRRPLHVRFERQPFNADHMSFIQDVLPRNWWPTDLETGIRLTAEQLLGHVQVG